MTVQCLEPKFYAQFIQLLGLSDDPDFTQPFNKALWAMLGDRLTGLFASKTRDEWAAIFVGTDACVAPVLDPEQAMAHPMNAARKVWQNIDGVLQAAPAPRFSTHAPHAPAPSPERGQHSQDILAELAASAPD